jgi:flagellar hook-associated protein 2
MASVSAPGIGSGLDVSGIVSSLMAVERQPLNLLQNAATKITTKVSAWGKIQSQLASLQDASRGLLNSTALAAAKATSSDEAKVKVSTAPNATVGNYELTVTQLAQKQSLTSSTLASSAAVVGGGSLTFTLGTKTTTNFVADSARSPTAVSVAAGATLQDIRDAINAGNAGVKASVVSDANGARLALRSATTGEIQAFEVAVQDDDLNNTDAQGLSQFAFSFNTTPTPLPTGGVAMAISQSAANAKMSIDGVPISSTTNTVEGAAENLTFELVATTSTPVNIAVLNDTDAMKKTVQTFVDAYNAITTSLAEQLKYDATTKKSGALQGDRAATQLQTQLREMLRTSVNSAGLTNLSDVGIQVQRNATLSVSSTKLEAALATPAKVATLFQAIDSTNPNAAGFARRFDARISNWLGSSGTVAGADQTLKSLSKANQQQQDNLNRRLESVQKSLLRTYTSLDQQLTQIKSTPIPTTSATSA